MTRIEARQSLYGHRSIFNIDISAGTYEVEAELLLKWRNDEDIDKIRSEFKDILMPAKKMEKIIDKIWHPEFIVKSELHRRDSLQHNSS